MRVGIRFVRETVRVRDADDYYNTGWVSPSKG